MVECCFGVRCLEKDQNAHLPELSLLPAQAAGRFNELDVSVSAMLRPASRDSPDRVRLLLGSLHIALSKIMAAFQSSVPSGVHDGRLVFFWLLCRFGVLVGGVEDGADEFL